MLAQISYRIVIHRPVVRIAYRHHISHLILLIERRPFFDLETVERDVLGIHAHDFFQRARPDIPGLSRDSEHKVHAHVIKTRTARIIKAFHKVFCRVYPAECLKYSIIKRLKPYRQSVHACTSIPFQSCFCKSPRICLHRYLRIIRNAKRLIDTLYK